MQVIGADAVRVATLADEHPQSVGEEAGWQESIALVWFDTQQGVGGICRIGHEPHWDDGKMQSWNVFYSLEGTYFRNQTILPLTPDNRPADGFNIGDIIRYRNDGAGHWRIRESDASAELHFENYHPMVENIPITAGSNHIMFAGKAGAFMGSGRVHGTCTIGDRTWRVDGCGTRNHSWGVRQWGSIRAHRWIAGSIDPRLSFCAYSFHGEGRSAVFGHVVRDGAMIFAQKTDIVTYTEVDGYGHRGGLVRMTLPDGEVLEIDVIPICKGVTGDFHDTLFALQTPCVARLGTREGLCFFESSANPNAGHVPPQGVINGVTQNGLTRVADPGNVSRLKPLHL